MLTYSVNMEHMKNAKILHKSTFELSKYVSQFRSKTEQKSISWHKGPIFGMNNGPFFHPNVSKEVRPHATVKNTRNMKFVSRGKLPYFKEIFKLWTLYQQELPILQMFISFENKNLAFSCMKWPWNGIGFPEIFGVVWGLSLTYYSLKVYFKIIDSQRIHGESWKTTLLQCYEVLWIDNFDAICKVRKPFGTRNDESLALLQDYIVNSLVYH